MFIVPVAPPGTGKSTITEMGRPLVQLIPELPMAPSTITRQKFTDDLANSGVAIATPEGLVFQTPYIAFIGELSTLIRSKDFEFMTDLTDIYDAGPWESSTYRHGNLKVEGVYLTLLGGITPKGIAQNWGREAFGQGFTSRLILVYSNDAKPIDLLQEDRQINFSQFAGDLRSIANMSGQFKMSLALKRQIHEWSANGMAPAPTDPRLAEYNTRRILHFLKLCMIYSAAESSSLEIEAHHVETAKSTLLSAELVMPLALEFVGASTLHGAIVDIHKWLLAEHAKGLGAISEQKLKRRLMLDVGPQHINVMVEQLQNSGLVLMENRNGGRFFTPTKVAAEGQ